MYTTLYQAEEPFSAASASSLADASTVIASGTLSSVEEGPMYELAKLDDGSTLYQGTVVLGITSGAETLWVVQDRPGALPYASMEASMPLGSQVALFAVDYVDPGVAMKVADSGIMDRHLLQLAHPSGLLIADAGGEVVPLFAGESSIENSAANLELLDEFGLDATSIGD